MTKKTASKIGIGPGTATRRIDPIGCFTAAKIKLTLPLRFVAGGSVVNLARDNNHKNIFKIVLKIIAACSIIVLKRVK